MYEAPAHLLQQVTQANKEGRLLNLNAKLHHERCPSSTSTLPNQDA